MNVKNWSIEWGGRTLSVEVGKLAHLVGGSCVVRYGDTVVMASAIMSEKKREGMDFFPLMVNFEEKFYASGRIKGSRFIKREGRPSEEAILSGRVIDRSIRPLFDQNMRNEVQVILTVLSWDGENDPQIPALIAASTALTISNVPWNGPIAGARVGRKDGKWILNPTVKEVEEGDADIIVSGIPDKLIMAEAGCKEVEDQDVVEGMEFGCKSMAPVLEMIEKIKKEIGQEKYDLSANMSESDVELQKNEDEIKAFVGSHAEDWIFDSEKKGRNDRQAMINKFKEAIEKKLKEKEVDEGVASTILGRTKIYIEEYITDRIIQKNKRLDGRGLDEVRDILVDTNLLPRVHGSGLFKRGDTQVLSIVTLGSPGDVQTIDTMEVQGTKRYMHHYNDTPASYGEAGFMRGPGNRAIGHGALAERALEPVLPDEADFPYAIRVVSEVLSSNGSSSMASTCGSTISLMDAGVPIKKPVAGIAMGLASNNKGEWKVITDLQDVEDGPGGMDFKITGTEDGVTAIQMDTKTDGLTWDIVSETFKKSKIARTFILDKIKSVIAEPKAEMSPFAPRIETIKINPDKIRDVIGPGGKMINKIIAETGAQIDIEDSGKVLVTSSDAEGMKKATDWIKELTHEVTAEEVYDGTVVRIEDFGAFVNILPGQDGLVHVSEISWERVNKPGDVLNLGDKVKVKVKEIDNLGRINLSMKALIPKPEGYVERPREERPRGGGFGGRGGGHRGGHSGGRGR